MGDRGQAGRGAGNGRSATEHVTRPLTSGKRNRSSHDNHDSSGRGRPSSGKWSLAGFGDTTCRRRPTYKHVIDQCKFERGVDSEKDELDRSCVSLGIVIS
jgi:hypothetical protein